MTPCRITLLVIPALLASSIAGATWPDDPLVNVPVSTVPGEKYDVFIVTDGQDGALIAWEDDRAGQTDIYLQRLDADGNPVWLEGGRVVCNAAEDQALYHSSDGTCGIIPMVSDSQGGAFVVWQDNRSFSFRQRDIYCQRMDGDGAPLWSANGVAVAIGAGNEDEPSMCSDGAGGVIIVWQDKNDDPIFNNLYGQRLNSDGQALWNSGAPMPIILLDWNQGSPTLCPDGQGGVFLVWSDNQIDVNDLHAQRLGPDGVALWETDGVVVVAADGNQNTPVIFMSNDGNPILSWRDQRGGDYDIYAQKLNSTTGASLWTGNGVALCTAANSQYRPSICTDGQGGAIVSWFDYRIASGPPWDLNIYAQRVLADGSTAWQYDGAPVCMAPDAQRDSRLISDGLGGALVAWEDNRAGEGREDIYMQHLDADGQPQLVVDGQAVCIASGNQMRPNLVLGAGGVIIAWPDDRNALYVPDIYADRVEINNSSPVSLPVAQAVTLKAWPNPFNPQTTITFSLERAGWTEVGVYDLTGRLLDVLANRTFDAGQQSVVWNGQDTTGRAVPSGTYVIRLETESGVEARKVMLLR